MRRFYLFIIAALLLCSCASTRNASRSSTQEQVTEQAETELETSTQTQTEEQRDVATVIQTTTETESTTNVYDTDKPPADSTGTNPTKSTTTMTSKTTSTTSTVDKSIIREIIDEQLREAANLQTTTNRQEDAEAEAVKEDSTPKNMRWLGIIAICGAVVVLCFCLMRFVRRK